MKKGEKKHVPPPPAKVLPDSPSHLRFTIVGAPRTKKNSGKIIQVRVSGGGTRPMFLPSDAWAEYEAIVKPELQRMIRQDVGDYVPINYKVRVEALFYRAADIGDWCGYAQGLGDLLQAAGVIADDILIDNWDGTRLMKDSAKPRVEVKIYRIGATQEKP
jgi:Holliday junction resolvase RusA-like endonuclease